MSRSSPRIAPRISSVRSSRVNFILLISTRTDSFAVRGASALSECPFSLAVRGKSSAALTPAVESTLECNDSLTVPASSESKPFDTLSLPSFISFKIAVKSLLARERSFPELKLPPADLGLSQPPAPENFSRINCISCAMQAILCSASACSMRRSFSDPWTMKSDSSAARSSVVRTSLDCTNCRICRRITTSNSFNPSCPSSSHSLKLSVSPMKSESVR
mmetsp:Transcript_82272/g.220819  ORF Transcript_82272/g.220819 Transcript_82272/m.220819 type:complete len:219 (-) Transcript_82272:300-956(-)